MKTVLGWTRNVWRFEEHGDCDYRLCLLQQEIIDGVAFYKAWNEWLRDHSVIFHDCIQCPSAISYCTSELQFVACLDVWECVCAWKVVLRKKLRWDTVDGGSILNLGSISTRCKQWKENTYQLVIVHQQYLWVHQCLATSHQGFQGSR